MISFTKMLEHMPVHKTATEHVLARQTQPVFTRVLAPGRKKNVQLSCWSNIINNF